MNTTGGPAAALVRYGITMSEYPQAGDASGTGLLNLESRDFDADLIRKIDPDWRSLFPDVIAPLATVGTLKRDVADRLGLPAGVIVAPGSGDNMMSALGSGCVSAGDLVVSLGTSGTVFGTSDVAVSDPTGTIAPFCDATGVRNYKQPCGRHVHSSVAAFESWAHERDLPSVTAATRRLQSVI